MRILFFIFSFLLTFGASAQVVVKGVVYDRDGPIHGVVVTEQKTDSLVNKVVTNHRGEFEITARNPKPLLHFSFVGLISKTILVKDNDPLKVKMKFDARRYQPSERN